MSKIVERTLNLLEVFAEQKRPLVLSEIARRLDIPASSCHDVVQILQEIGYLYELSPRGGYYPTLRIYEVARAIAESDPVVLRADVVLRELCDSMEESILLSKVHGLQATYLLAFQPLHPLRVLIKAGDGVGGLHNTSAGKALLGSLSGSAFDGFLKSCSLAASTPHTITTKAALRKDIQAGNERGWFLNRQESLDGVITVSIRFGWVSATYIVTIAGPASRMEDKLERAVHALSEIRTRLEMR